MAKKAQKQPHKITMSRHLRAVYGERFDEAATDVRAHESRFQILENVLDLIMKQGIEALTLSELSRRSGYSKARILYHYRDLNDAVFDLFDLTVRVGQKITVAKVQAIPPQKNPADAAIAQISAILEASLEWTGNYPECGRFFLMMFSFASKIPQLLKRHGQLLETGRARVETILASCMSAEKAREASHLLHTQILGVSVRMISQNQFKHQREIYAHSAKHFRKIIDAYL